MDASVVVEVNVVHDRKVRIGKRRKLVPDQALLLQQNSSGVIAQIHITTTIYQSIISPFFCRRVPKLIYSQPCNCGSSSSSGTNTSVLTHRIWRPARATGNAPFGGRLRNCSRWSFRSGVDPGTNS